MIYSTKSRHSVANAVDGNSSGDGVLCRKGAITDVRPETRSRTRRRHSRGHPLAPAAAGLGHPSGTWVRGQQGPLLPRGTARWPGSEQGTQTPSPSLSSVCLWRREGSVTRTREPHATSETMGRCLVHSRPEQDQRHRCWLVPSVPLGLVILPEL